MPLEHRDKSAALDVGGPNTIKVSWWNKAFIATGGADKLPYVRDVAHANGAEFTLLTIEGGGTGAANAGDARINLDVYSRGEVDLLVTSATPGENSVTNAMLRDSAACSLMGRAANSIGDPADILSTLDGQVARRAAGVVGFGALDLSNPNAVTGQLPPANLAPGSAIPPSLIDARGDLLVGTADNTVTRQPVGPNGQVLMADSTQATGVKWAPAPGAALALDQWLQWGGVNTIQRTASGRINIEPGVSEHVVVKTLTGPANIQSETAELHQDATLSMLAQGNGRLFVRYVISGGGATPWSLGTDGATQNFRFSRDWTPSATNQVWSVPLAVNQFTMHLPLICSSYAQLPNNQPLYGLNASGVAKHLIMKGGDDHIHIGWDEGTILFRTGAHALGGFTSDLSINAKDHIRLQSPGFWLLGPSDAFYVGGGDSATMQVGANVGINFNGTSGTSRFFQSVQIDKTLTMIRNQWIQDNAGMQLIAGVLYQGTPVVQVGNNADVYIPRNLHVATTIYKAAVGAYTFPDYVFEHWATGRIVEHAKAPGAEEYHGLRALEDLRGYVEEHWRLPHVTRDGDMFRRLDDLLAELERVYLYLFDHERRLAAQEGA